MLKLAEFWSDRAHSEDFTRTCMDFITVRLRLLTYLLVIGLPAWAVVDWMTLPRGHFQQLLLIRIVSVLALLPIIPFSSFMHYCRERMKLALSYLMIVMMSFSLFCLHSFAPGQALQAGYEVFPYLLITLFAIFPIPLSMGLQLGGVMLATMLLGCCLLTDQSLWSQATLNRIWVFGMFTLVSCWVQCGQLSMLLRLYRESTTDELTGMMNRRLLMKQLEQARIDLLIHRRPFALLLLDLDRFKRINDIYGHLTGDAVLREVAMTLDKQLSAEMVLGRCGGEEFAILMYDYRDPAVVSRVAERLRIAIEARLVKSPTSDELLEITVSIGIALARVGESTDDLIHRADACLYQAKMAGRNCVVVEQSDMRSTDAA